MKRFWNSGFVAVLILGIVGTAIAYRKISRRQALQMRERQERIAAEAHKAISDLNIDLSQPIVATPAHDTPERPAAGKVMSEVEK